MWRSAKGDTKGWVEFDLGKPQKLIAISVWNYNETWHTERGVRNMSISVWTQETGWQRIREDLPLDPAGPKAGKLFPDDGTEGVGVNDLELTWVAAQGAKTHNIYLGAGPDDLKLIGKAERAGVKLSQLKCNTRYYWRVDEVQADGSMVSGTVRSFTTGGLAGWWKLDETEGTKAADSAGNHHDGLTHGNPAWRPRGGKMAGGLQFDGMQDFVDTGWTADLATWTVAVRVKSPSSPASSPVPSGPVDRQANFQINWNHRKSELRGAAALCIGATWHGASFGGLDPGVWYHLAATFDGQTLKAYKDGVLISENPHASGRPAHESATLKLGKNAVDEGYFAGTIDDVCIFTYALNADEVRALYSGKEPTAIVAGSALPSADGLSAAAYGTYIDYRNGVRAGAENRQDEIPQKYWAPPIKALNPVKVYLHRVNVVVVQRVHDGIEEGKYIHILISSYLPLTGDDGFEFTPNPLNGNKYDLGDGGLDFKRTRTAMTLGFSATPTTSSTFGIYLVEAGDLVLSDQDIAAYVRATHEIKLNESGIAKWKSWTSHLGRPEGLYRKDFAIRIDNKEIYRGKFWSMISSLSYEGVVILDVAFPRAPDTIQIEYGYPGSWHGSKDDPRSSPEIFDFFAKKGMLK